MKIVFTAVLSLITSLSFKIIEPNVIETKAGKELIPEGIAVHPKTGAIYLSSLHQNKIVVVEKNGKIKDLIKSGEEGFMAGLGMKIDNAGKTIWALSAYNDSFTHKTGLFQIDLKTGRVLQKFLRTDSVDCFFNDLVIDKNGNIYITDTQQSSVFKWNAKTKEISRWLQNNNLHWANGIALAKDEKTLFVAAGDKGINAIDVETKQIKLIAKPNTDFYAIDGLGFYKNCLIGVIGWPHDKPKTHRVLQFHLKPDNTLLKIDTLNINNSQINCPTTLSIINHQLFVLAKTNLGVYNRHKQNTGFIQDSLLHPVILQYSLK